MKTHILSNKEKQSVTFMGKRYYESIIKRTSFSSNCRYFGVEIEFSLIDRNINLVPNSSYTICKNLCDEHIVPEYGSFQIEVNPEPFVISDSSFDRLYRIIQKKRRKIEKVCVEKDIQLLPVGIPFNIDKKLLYQDNIVTKIPRYLISKEYFHQINKTGATIWFSNGQEMNLLGNSGLSIINELHVHVQALDIDDLIDLFNFSQMITAPFVSLSANSGILNGKELFFRDHQISIFEQAEGVFDGPQLIPRVGLFPGYIDSIDDFFQNILLFKPLYYPEDQLDKTAFELIIGKYFGWTRIRVGYEPSFHLRIEFRPMSSQPTIIENISLSEFYINILLGLIDNDIDLIPEKYLKENFYKSMKQGMAARLYWDLGDGLDQYPVNKILRYLFDFSYAGRYSELMIERLNYNLSPVEKFLKDCKKVGFDNMVNHYMNCFADEIPII